MKAKTLPSYNDKKKPVQNHEKISFNGVSSNREATEEVEDQQQACTININSSGISREGVKNTQTS